MGWEVFELEGGKSDEGRFGEHGLVVVLASVWSRCWLSCSVIPSRVEMVSGDPEGLRSVDSNSISLLKTAKFQGSKR